MEQVSGFTFSGISVVNNLTWSSHMSILLMKAQVLINFYKGERESILTENITNWPPINSLMTFTEIQLELNILNLLKVSLLWGNQILVRIMSNELVWPQCVRAAGYIYI